MNNTWKERLIQLDKDYRENNGYYLGATDKACIDLITSAIKERDQQLIKMINGLRLPDTGSDFTDGMYSGYKSCKDDIKHKIQEN